MHGRARVTAKLTILMGFLIVASACQGGQAASPSVQAPSLMEQLATSGDQGLFTTRYVAQVGTDAILYVGVKDGSAIAYLCDPATGSRWLAGTATAESLELKDAKGGRLTGRIVATRLDATLSGMPGFDGDVSLAPAGPDTILVRQRGVTPGELVGGLVQDAGVIRGVLNVTASGLGLSSPAPSTQAGATVGCRSPHHHRAPDRHDPGRHHDLDLAQALPRRGGAIVNDEARKARTEIERMAATLNVVMVIVSIVLVVIAIVVAVVTSGTASAVAVPIITAAVEGRLAKADLYVWLPVRGPDVHRARGRRRRRTNELTRACAFGHVVAGSREAEPRNVQRWSVIMQRPGHRQPTDPGEPEVSARPYP